MAWPSFGRKSQVVPRPLPGIPVGVPSAEPPQGYEAQVREAYLRNAVGQRAVRMVAEAASSAPLVADGLPEHLCEQVSALLTPALVETVATHLLLHGNAFVDTGLDHRDQPVALWALRPERMQMEADAQGWAKAWLYRAGGRAVRYPVGGEAGTLVHIRTANPLDDHLGLGCVAAAAAPAQLMNQAARWNATLLGNAARPSGALVINGDGPLSSEQFERLRDEIAAGFQGAANAGRPMLLEGGLSWQPLAMTPAEMDFARAREAASREVALAFGVPPMLLGLPGDSTHANYAEANVSLWRLTILPLLQRFLAAMSVHLQGWWPGVRLSVDLDAVPALWGDRERLWRHVAAADFLTVDEKRELLGWAPMECGQ